MNERPVSDDELVLLYYGEHDDPGLARRVAQSMELSRRFARLTAELARAEHYRAPERGEDYGPRVWQAIGPRLAPRLAAEKPRWWQALAVPRLSLAGAFGVAAVALLAFWLGREQAAPVAAPPQIVLAPASDPAVQLDPVRLLSASVSGHLDSLDRVLTQFANAAEPAVDEAALATDMLVANRLYRHAAQARGDQRTADFLEELEPLLIELAYEAQHASPATRSRLQEEVRDGLLFRLRVMNQQLKNPGIRT